MQIEVVNKRANRRRHGIYIGRPSVLGNPYALSATWTREESVEASRQWLRRQWREGGVVKDTLVQMAQAYKETRALTLVCWCKPYACHGDVRAEAVMALVRKGLV